MKPHGSAMFSEKIIEEEGLTKRQAPVFTVVIPAYKAAHHIADALASVFEQTFKDYEIIVINDGSPDTPSLEQQLQPYLSRITYIAQRNRGPGGARNAGILRARGEYIAFLDSDDQWLPQHLTEMVEALERNPGFDLVYADAINFGDRASEGCTTMESNPSEGLATFESLVLEKCSVVGSTVIARRQSLIDAGLFDESFVHGEDFDLWTRLAYRGGRIDYMKRIHTRRRIHDGNLTRDLISSFDGQVNVLKKLLREFDIPDDLKQRMQVQIEKCNASIALEKFKKKLVDREYRSAYDELQRANTMYRSSKLQLALFLLQTAPRLVRYFYVRKQNNDKRGIGEQLRGA